MKILHKSSLEKLRYVVTEFRKYFMIKEKLYFRNKDKTRGQEQTNQKQMK